MYLDVYLFLFFWMGEWQDVWFYTSSLTGAHGLAEWPGTWGRNMIGKFVTRKIKYCEKWPLLLGKKSWRYFVPCKCPSKSDFSKEVFQYLGKSFDPFCAYLSTYSPSHHCPWLMGLWSKWPWGRDKDGSYAWAKQCELNLPRLTWL